MTRFSRDRFTSLWQSIGLAMPDGLFDALRQRYAEPHRAYHTAQHIDECLEQLDLARASCERPAEVELALWFHDAIYDTTSHDNELRSAEWAAKELTALPEVAESVHALILLTRHDAVATTPDGRLLVDIDLSILGAPRERFLEYESQVRREYAWVPEEVFRRERAKILRRFLERPSIYATELFRERLESRARENLAASL